MRRVLPDDIATLVALMAEFYAEADYCLDHPLAEKAFAAILSDERLGYVWLIDEDGKLVGYVVLTFRFGMEYGGLMACLDDLFAKPKQGAEHRRPGPNPRLLQEHRYSRNHGRGASR